VYSENNCKKTIFFVISLVLTLELLNSARKLVALRRPYEQSEVTTITFEKNAMAYLSH